MLLIWCWRMGCKQHSSLHFLSHRWQITCAAADWGHCHLCRVSGPRPPAAAEWQSASISTGVAADRHDSRPKPPQTENAHLSCCPEQGSKWGPQSGWGGARALAAARVQVQTAARAQTWAVAGTGAAGWLLLLLPQPPAATTAQPASCSKASLQDTGVFIQVLMWLNHPRLTPPGYVSRSRGGQVTRDFSHTLSPNNQILSSDMMWRSRCLRGDACSVWAVV